MKFTENLEGRTVRLPDGETRVIIETVYSDGKARLRRVEGDLKGIVALYQVEKLLPDEGHSDRHAQPQAHGVLLTDSHKEA